MPIGYIIAIIALAGWLALAYGIKTGRDAWIWLSTPGLVTYHGALPCTDPLIGLANCTCGSLEEGAGMATIQHLSRQQCAYNATFSQAFGTSFGGGGRQQLGNVGPGHCYTSFKPPGCDPLGTPGCTYVYATCTAE